MEVSKPARDLSSIMSGAEKGTQRPIAPIRASRSASRTRPRVPITDKDTDRRTPGNTRPYEKRFASLEKTLEIFKKREKRLNPARGSGILIARAKTEKIRPK